jgi:aspartate-semialdehyde dehydrogenase
MGVQRREVGVLGATGIVGQQLVRRLAGHPWFRITWVGASERSAGTRYGDRPWLLPGAPPDEVRDLIVETPLPGRAPQLVFSALDAQAATALEPAYAAAGHTVVSNARSFRMDPDIPLVIPEVNAAHLGLIPHQRASRHWSGAIITNPNCSTVFLALALGALRRLEPTRVVVTTLQAVSGAGYPGVPSWDVLGNVIPFIDGEEQKIETETPKILGTLESGRVVNHGACISAQTTRVPVLEGHTETISVGFRTPPALADVVDAFRGFRGDPAAAGLPSSPATPIVVLEQADRPQPRLDADRGAGMTVSIGRIRPCPLLDVKFVALGHNTVRGAAGAAILNAELLAGGGWLGDGVTPW